MTLRKTGTAPPIHFLHGEDRLVLQEAEWCAGLAAGYLSVRDLGPSERKFWSDIFARKWEGACLSFGEALKEMGVDAFAIVPCSRSTVTTPLSSALRTLGLRELQTLIQKTDPRVSFAGKARADLASRVKFRLTSEALADVRKIAVCDDFAESGKTLWGLGALLRAGLVRTRTELVLAAVGVSKSIAELPAHDVAGPGVV